MFFVHKNRNFTQYYILLRLLLPPLKFVLQSTSFFGKYTKEKKKEVKHNCETFLKERKEINRHKNKPKYIKIHIQCYIKLSVRYTNVGNIYIFFSFLTALGTIWLPQRFFILYVWLLLFTRFSLKRSPLLDLSVSYVPRLS